MIYSFDVFDTLITRKTATPLGVFAYIQKKLQEDKKYIGISSFIRNHFYELRIGAESAARTYFYTEETPDITLEQIYEVMGRTACLTNADMILLVALEREIELTLSGGIGSNINYLKKLHEQGDKVILISDMYLDSATIRKMLLKEDSVFGNIPLYVSSETMKNKVSGKMYTHVMEKEQIPIGEWVHIGDNPYSDVSVPQKVGIAVSPVKAKTLLPCEEAALEAGKMDLYVQFAIGASANARLFSQSETVAYRYGTSLGGNIAYPYVYWLIQRSLELGIKRLYFIARDGYLLKEIADSIIAKMHYDISTFYIYGSRKSWRLPALSKAHFDISLMLQWDTIKKVCRIDRLADLFEMGEDLFRTFLSDKYKDRNEKLAYEEFQNLIYELEQNSDFKEAVLQKQKEKHILFKKYLEQNVDTSDEHFAFVELIGSGYTQRSLSYVLEEICSYPTQTFFYQLDAKLDTDSCKYYCYIPAVMQDGGIMELFYTAPHGHTIGYIETEGGRIEPILDGENDALQEYGLNDYTLGVQDFLKEYTECAGLVEEDLDNPDLSLFYRRYLAGELDEELLDYIGDMPYKANGTEGQAEKYAPVLSSEMLRLLCVSGGYSKVMEVYTGSNFSLSQKRSDRKLWDRLRKIYGFPIDKLEKRIAIYGAGKFGQALYREIELDSAREVVVWADKNYADIASNIPNVTAVEQLEKGNYDQVVIAILNLEVANEVKQSLIESGIAKEKIITYELALRLKE